ncbi:hypothetical protein OROMI_007058 [Orobanche minor]
MASSPNVRPYPNSATGVDAESTTAAAAVAASVAAAAAASAAAAATTTLAENQVVWKRPNMRGSKCSINGYVRLGIVKTITAELRSVGDDTFREFRESCLGHFIREEWGGFVSNAALHALFLNDVVRLDTQVDEFWFRTGHRLIRLVTGLRFGDSNFDVHGDDVPLEGSVDIWACEAIPSLGSKCGIMLGASFIQQPRCTRWKLKKLGHIDFTTFFDDESVDVGAACGASASWFLMLQDASTLIDAEHLDAYMVILQFDPDLLACDGSMIGLPRLFWFIRATCINVWNNSQRKGGPLSIDDEDLDFLVSHIHGLRPFWGDHRPWWELREVLTIWNTSPESSCGHWLVLRIRLEEGIIIMHDSLAHEEDAYLKLRSQQSLAIIFLIPTIIQRSVFYERRLDITPVPQFRVAIAKKDLCYVQDDSTFCGALSIHTLESLVQHSFSHGKTETDIYAFRGRMARAIWRFSDDADTVVCDPTSLFIRFDNRD